VYRWGGGEFVPAKCLSLETSYRCKVSGGRISIGAVLSGDTSTRTSAMDAERSRCRESTSESGWINSDRYCGAAPFRQRCTRTQSLYWMRSGTRSQCKFTSSGVTWSNLRASAVSRAALLQRSERTESDRSHAVAIHPGRLYSCRSWT